MFCTHKGRFMKRLLILSTILAAGCASLPEGIKASPEELEACNQETCSVWTMEELERLFKAGVLRGLIAGRNGRGT